MFYFFSGATFDLTMTRLIETELFLYTRNFLLCVTVLVNRPLLHRPSQMHLRSHLIVFASLERWSVVSWDWILCDLMKLLTSKNPNEDGRRNWFIPFNFQFLYILQENFHKIVAEVNYPIMSNISVILEVSCLFKLGC